MSPWNNMRALLLVAVLCALAAALAEDDFAFEDPAPAAPLRRLWGVPDAAAAPGRLFYLAIPSDAFSGTIDHYEARGPGGRALPAWLQFDGASGVFEGVPERRDVGETYITVRAVGPGGRDAAKDVFSIEVLERRLAQLYPLIKDFSNVHCDAGEDPTYFTIIMDMKFEHMKPKQRILAIKNLSGFLSLHHSLFRLQPYVSQEDLLSDDVILAGPGNVKKKANKHSTILQWQVGCDGHLWKQYSTTIRQLEQQARDGTLAEVLQQSVIGWHVKTESSTIHRERRELGSGDFGDDNEESSDYGDEDELERELVPNERIVPTMPSPVFPEPTTHHHRHHHGEIVDHLDLESSSIVTSTISYRLPTSPVINYNTIISTPVLVPVRPTILLSSEVFVQPSRVYEAEVTPSYTPVLITDVEPSVTPEMLTTQVTEPLPSSSSSESSSSSSWTTGSTSSSGSSSTTEGSSTSEETSQHPSPTTDRSTSPRTYGEIIETDVKNFQPTIETRLPKVPITAGKALRFVIPENAFSDLEDGNTRNLSVSIKNEDGSTLSSTGWVQFNSEQQEVYALPLDENVSKWPFIVEVTDKEGKSVSDHLVITVQHHKGRRTVNHEFTLLFHIEKSSEFQNVVDWQFRILDSLSHLYQDSDWNQITVLRIKISDPIEFTWTNDSVPRDVQCPKEEIERLYKILVDDEAGTPASDLRELLGPAFKVKKVTHKGVNQCERPTHVPPKTPPKTEENYSPVPRNQVDHLKAYVGQLLVFVVPEDTFYDPEDGNVRNLKLTLVNGDRSPISSDNWLQFDVKNQEFYGLPLPGDEGTKQYQLICEDKGGLAAYDGLEVEVVGYHVSPLYNVEFSMALNIPYMSFRHSALKKRKFVEKMRDLFGDKNTSAISIKDIMPGSSIVTWHNRTLPRDDCPEDEIKHLQEILVNDDESINERVKEILGGEFPVHNISLTPAGRCVGEFTVVHADENPLIPVDETPVGPSDEYLFTYVVPVVIIVTMLLLAGIVACILYRRRRTGKMNIGDEDERQSFRNKGIPVIFQDELEERPDPGNKSPVIMKEEKPPLPPPEYHRESMERATPPPLPSHPLLADSNVTEDAPYQPPPPFTSSRDSGRQNRPKPTPTYRKPPPYVPP